MYRKRKIFYTYTYILYTYRKKTRTHPRKYVHKINKNYPGARTDDAAGRAARIVLARRRSLSPSHRVSLRGSARPARCIHYPPVHSGGARQSGDQRVVPCTRARTPPTIPPGPFARRLCEKPKRNALRRHAVRAN